LKDKFCKMINFNNKYKEKTNLLILKSF